MAETTNQTPDEGQEPETGTEGVPEPEEGGQPEDLNSGDDDDYEPPTREKPWSNRKERAEFFKNKHQEENPEIPEDKIEQLVNERIGSVLDEKLGQFSEAQEAVLIKNEVNTFVQENPQFAKYAKKAEKAAKVYSNVPIDTIFKGLAYDDAFKEGAEHKGNVDRRVKANAVVGKVQRQAAKSNTPDFENMTDAEIEKFNASMPREGVKIEE